MRTDVSGRGETPLKTMGGLDRRPANITIHETSDPEVIVAEFEYQGTSADTGEPLAQPGSSCSGYGDGQIVESCDYRDQLTAARIRGQFGELVAAVEDIGAVAAQ